jgi:ribonuclease P protein component
MERLKGKKQIEQLFVGGRSVGAFPLRLVYVKTEGINKVGVSVSKKHFKNAVDRNKIKRLLRVATENHFHGVLEKLGTKYCLMVLYVGKEIPRSKELNTQFTSMIKRFSKKILNEA